MLSGMVRDMHGEPAVRAAILQPSYLPWLGFFHQMAQSDVFVVLDDVQYDKHGWRNRNRIKTAQDAQWLTVPVLTKSQGKPLVKDVLINNGNAHWRSDHLKSIQQNYSKAPFFGDYLGIFSGIYSREWERLIDADMAFIMALKDALQIATKIEFASNLEAEGDRVQRLVSMCKKLGAEEFLEGGAGRNYLAGNGEQLFASNGIKLIYHDYQHPTYPQLYGEFIPYLSVVDLLFNCGGESLDILTGKMLIGRKEATT